MTKSLWINLPVKDAAKSREFFTKIGFTLNDHYPNSDSSASFLVGEQKLVLMLFNEDQFKGFTRHPLTDTSQSSEVLFSFDAENREEVDALASSVRQAGGTIYAEPADTDGWMYGFAFLDLDGHRWNVLHMDMSKMPH